ncbi:ferritin-like domain-containing protein [Ditylenchus destructor]|uniref:Ferritin n=1 Tax=Ditylenchus destructor TaxID=166010 RepID=A0AAD4N0K5_9BILA|nr:ferritin-like domain-containing protein [Ditylenchus destructor]
MSLLNRLLIPCRYRAATSKEFLALAPLAQAQRAFYSRDKDINKPFPGGGTISRRNYAPDVEEAVNQQINKELESSYRYGAMANYFDRANVALPGGAKFFSRQSTEERIHAQLLIDYQNSRAGKVILSNLQAPENQKWHLLLDAFVDALEVETRNDAALHSLHRLAAEKEDLDLTSFIEENFLREQVMEIDRMTRIATQLKRVGSSGLGEYLIDQQLLQQYGQAPK